MGNFISKNRFFSVLVASFLLSINFLQAQTNVSGVISANTTWTLANSPYVIKGNLLVNSGVTLTIEPGVVVKVDGNYYIKIEGKLDATGSINSKITFETNLPNPTDTSKNSWYGIQIRPTGGSIINNDLTYFSGTKIKYVVVKNANKGIYVYSTGVYISNSEFNNNNIGIEFRSSNNVVIDNCTFIKNSYGTYTDYESYGSDGTSSIENTFIQNSTFYNNTIGNYFFLNQREFKNLNVNNNLYKQNQTGVIFSGGGYGCRVFSTSIRNNNFIDNTNNGLEVGQIYGDGSGIGLPSYPLIVEKNIFVRNSVLWNYGGGISGVTIKFVNNIISNTNTSGITIKGQTSKNDLFNNNYINSNIYAIAIDGISAKPHNKTFSSNLISGKSSTSLIKTNGSGMAVINNNFITLLPQTVLQIEDVNTVNAVDNYWGTTSLSSINEMIYDKNENFELGVATITTVLNAKNIAAPISLPINVTKQIESGRVKLTWTANTESDIAGYKIHYGGFTGYSYTTSADAGNVLTYTLPAGVAITEDIAVTAYDASKDGTDDQYDGNESWYSPANKAPEAPVNLVAYSSGHKIKLNWDVSTSTGVNNYNIYRSTDGTTYTKLISTTNNTYTNTGLTGYIKYYYKVAAFDSLDLSYDNYGLESALTSSVNGTATNKFYVDSAIGNDANGIGSSDSPYKKITNAVNAAIAGDTILVGKGTYLDNVILTKELTIIAQNTQANTILKPLLPNSQIVNFTSGSNSSKLSGFTLTGGGNVRGSAIDCNFSSPTIEKCIITNSGGEAPIRYYYSDAVINNCLIYKNTGSSVFFYSPIPLAPKVNHSTIVYNSGIGTGSSNTSVIPVFTNCIIYGNSGGTYGGNINILNSVIQGDYPGNESNVNANPKFIDSLINDYRLQDYSPAIGLGVDMPSITKDFVGNNKPLPVSSKPDAGAYENIFDHPAPFIDTDSSRNGFVLLKMTQTPAGSVNKISIYKGLTTAPTTKYKDTTLVSKYADSANSIFNKIIYYRLTSVGSSNLESGYSNEVRTISFTPPSLNFPTDLSIKADTNINFQWGKIDNATNYKIQYSTDSNFVTNVVELSKTDTSHLKTSLVDNTTYFWRLQTLDSVHYSKWSNFKKFQTFVRKPNLNTITTVNRVVTINWSVNSLRNIKAFKIYRGTETNPTTKLDSISSASLTYNDSVTNGVKYYYRVTAVNSDNVESLFSNELYANSFGTTILDSPTNNKVKEGLNPIFKWNNIEFASKNNIQISVDPNFTGAYILDTITTLNTLGYTKGLSDNTTFYWRVRVGDDAGYGNWTEKNVFQTYVLAPNLNSVTPSNRIDTIKWSVQSSNNIKYFKIFRDTVTNPKVLLDSISSTLRTYIDTSKLQLNKKYFYSIITGNNENIESGFSNVLSATPFNTNPKTVALINKTYNNVGEFNYVRTTYSSSGSLDIDGRVANYKWYVNDSLVNAIDSILVYYFNHGSNKVKLVITDNDGGKDSSNAVVNLSSFVKSFEGGFLGGITALSPNIIYTADTTFNPINGASISKLDRSGNSIYPLVVSSKIFTTPSVSSDSSVFITSGSSLNGFNKSGAPLWSTIPLGGLSYVTPTIDSLFNRIYVGVSNKNFFAIDYKTGKVVWNLIGDAPVNASAVITGDRKLVFTSQAGTLYGFDIRTNVAQTAAKWSTNFGEVVTKSPAVDANNNLIFGTESGKVLKVKLNDDGTVARTWSVNINATIQSSPVIDGDGFIYIGNTAGDFYKLNPDNGAVIWKYATGAAIKSTPTISEFGNIYISNTNGIVTALTTGKILKWTYQADGPISANMLYISNMLYIGTEKGKLFAIYDNPVTNTVNTGLSINVDKSRFKNYSYGSLASSSPLNLDEKYGYYYDAFKKGNFNFTIIDNVITKEPVWGTFQGNFRRTGSKSFECPELPVLKIPNCTETADTIKITTSNLTNKYWVVNDVVLDKVTDTSIYIKSTDKYKLMAFNKNGCNVYSTSPIFILNSDVSKPALITSTGTDKFCQNDSVVLSTNISAYKYQWNYSGYVIAGAKSKTLTTNLSGAYSLSVVNSYGCKSTSDISLIMSVAKPNAPSISRDASGNLVSSSSSGNQWYKDGVILPGATSATFKPIDVSNYSLTTSTYGCVSSMSNTYFFLVTDVINLSATEFIKLAPNPFQNKLNFDFVVKGYQKLNFDVFELATGRKVTSRVGLTPGSPVYLPELVGGTYIVRITSADGKLSYQFKMVKM
jgi:hypothetical protein